MQNIEFLCINDGSTDSSKDIINHYVSIDDRFVLVDKPNSGYGASLNMGFDLSKGKYIGIVESDDYVEKDMFSTLFLIAEKSNVDLVKSNYYKFTTNDGVEIQRRIANNATKGTVLQPCSSKKIFFNMTSNWAALYSKEFLISNNIRHRETPGASYQDISFFLKVLSHASTVYYTDKPLYHYRIDNQNSSIHQDNKIFKVFDEYQYIFDYYKDRKHIGE